ncbi:MAG: phage tail tape measure protein [Paracoccaceae bacterium]
MDDLDALAGDADALSDTLARTSDLAAAFTAELTRTEAALAGTSRQLSGLERRFSSDLRSAFDSVLVDGGKLSTALRDLAGGMSRSIYTAATKPVIDGIGGALAGGVGGLMSAMTPFAKGGVVQGATPFAMHGGLGVAGEAGPEAILPLARDAQGRLGVAGGGGATNVTINVTTPDAGSFRRSSSQIAAEMGRALSRGRRNG